MAPSVSTWVAKQLTHQLACYFCLFLSFLQADQAIQLVKLAYTVLPIQKA